MKKKVFSLMMTLLLAFMGVAKAETVEIGTGTSTSYYIPFNSLYGYSFTEQVYSASDIGTAGSITSIGFYLGTSNSTAQTNQIALYMKNVSRSSFSSTSDYETVTTGDIVYSGMWTIPADYTGWVYITLDTPFAYDGVSNLMVAMHEMTSGYSTRYFTYTSVTNACVQWYSDTYNPDPYNLGSYSGSTYTRNYLANAQLEITAGGAGAGEQIFAVQDGNVVDTVFVGPRPNGYWMEPFTFQVRNTGANTVITRLDWTPDNYFTLVAPELPVQIAHDEDIDVQLTTGTTSNTDWQMVAIYGTGRTAAIWNINAEPYDAQTPDVWELACEEATTFPFVERPARTHAGILHNDYTLPFPEIPEGYDAVYKLVFESDMILNAEVTDGENGKVALYAEGFNGEGGPMATNYYTGLAGANGGGGSTIPFEAQIGEGTSTSTYFPFYTFYNYCIAENLFLAAELTEAGVTSAPMTSLSWYATNAPGYEQQGITIWMANVDDEALTTTSHPVTDMTKVYTGAMTPAIGWNEFVLNEDLFSWDGHSNVLIYVQRNNGTYNSSVNWQATAGMPFNAMSYRYQDSGAYDATIANTMYTSTTRPNIIMKGGNRERPANSNLTVHDFTDSNGYVPVYGFYADAFLKSEMVYPAAELSAMNGGAINSMKFYSSTPSVSWGAANFQVFLTEVASASISTFNGPGTMVYTGALSIDGNGEMTVNFTTPYNYNGGNLLVGVYNTVEGTYVTSTWIGETVNGSSVQGYSYTDLPSITPTQRNFLPKTTFNYTSGGSTPTPGPTPGPTPAPNPGSDLQAVAGPVIQNLGVRPGTYYLVASSTYEDFEVTINAEDMPCPATNAEGFAFNPTPADNADEIEPRSVTLSWNIPDYATGWRLIFGSTYYPDPNHDQTIMYPEDGSFTNQMANSFTVRNLWNNTNYFWHVDFNNDACPDGVSSPIWGFTTHLNIPQNLTVEDETVFDDETITLNWSPVVDRTYRMYNIYRDGQLIASTQVNNIGATTYTDGPLAYNMDGYTYYVTAVYDEGESAPSNTVNVKVSGYGDVNGHVYEQDGTTGIAGATVTMVGQDEFGVSHTYNFNTNGEGYYTGHIYAGSYNGSAYCDGYQGIDHPIQGNPIDIAYNNTTTPIDYMMDENFNPVCAVIAEYYPDSLDPNSPYVKVYWGCGLPGSDIIEDFETGDFSLFDWQIDANYPWSITTTSPYEGTYCMKSGGAGVASVVSNMSVTVDIPTDGLMSFFSKISCESNWDYGYFYIDGVQRGSYTGAGNWGERTFDITAGEHTFQWQYTKDASVNSNDDCFYVDYINFCKQPEPSVPGMTYDFDNGTMQGWTSVDADGDGYGWMVASELMSGVAGHNGSTDFIFSQSYNNTAGVLYPDNYLVSPMVQLGGVLRFYACAQDNLYAAEHFGVAVSTTNTNPSSFTMLQEWTMSAKSVGESGKAVLNSRSGREQGNWYEYTVDLSAYSGNGYVAIRHFNCSDMFYLDVDDITISDPGKSVADFSRRFSHYRVYRTNCYQESPFTEDNTVVLACELQDTIYIDVEWADLEPGVYKWGVGVVYTGNRGEEVESPITWTEPVNIEPAMAPRETVTIGDGTGTTYYGPYNSLWGYSFVEQVYTAAEIGTAGTINAISFNMQSTDSQTNQIDVFMKNVSRTSFASNADWEPVTASDMVFSGNVTFSNGWTTITLDTPFQYNGTDNLMIGMHEYTSGYSTRYFYYTSVTGALISGHSDSSNPDPYNMAGYSGTMYVQNYRNNIQIDITPGGGSGSGGQGGVAGGNEPIQEPRESVIVWSNCLDKDMYLNNVDVTVLLNSADSPEGTTVTLTNLNEAEQELYPVAPVVLDETGFYAWESFRRGDYSVKVELDGYEIVTVDSVHIWSETHLRYVLIEILYGIDNIYVSRTGWAMWNDSHNNPGGNVPGGNTPTPGGNGDTFDENFDGGIPAGWTNVDADGDGYTWVSSMTPGNYHNAGVDLTGSGHNGSAQFVISGSYANGTGQVLYPDNYLVSPQVTLAAGSTFSFWACAQDASYAAEHFGVAISDNGTSNWTMVQEWTLTAKSTGAISYGRDGQNRAQGNWYNYSVDLSAYAGQKYIAIRHFNCSDQFILNVDDIQLTSGAKSGNEMQHFEYYKVMCTSIDGVPIYNHNTVYPFCQLSTNEPYNAPLVEGEHYLCKVATVYSTGMSAWSEPVEWEYEPCDHWGPVDEVTVNTTSQGNHIEWVFDHGYNPYGGDTPGPGPGPGPQPGNDVTVILTAGDVWGDGSGYQMLLDADANTYGTIIPETGALSTNCSGNEAIYAEFEYKIPANADGNCSTSNMVMNNSISITIPAGTYDWCVTNPTPGDRIWIASAQGNVGGRQDNYVFEAGNTYEFTVSMLGSNDQVNVVVTGGAKNSYAPLACGEVKDIANVTPVSRSVVKGGEFYTQYAEDGIMLNFLALDNVNFRVYLLNVLSNDSRFSLVPEDEYGQFVLTSMTASDFANEFETVYSNAVADFNLLSKVDIDNQMNTWKSSVSPTNLVSVMMDVMMSNNRPDNEHCINSLPFCTSEVITFEAANTSNTANEPGMDDGCIGSSYNPSFYHMRIHTGGPFVIHMEGHDPNSGVDRDIDFCMWGPYTEQEVTSGAACQNLSTNKIVDCCYSASYTEDCYIGYPEGQHDHNTSHGTVNYHVPEVGEYYILMITNYSQQPCVINFTKSEGDGETDCEIVVPTDLIGFLITEDGEYVAFAGPDDREYTVEGEFGAHTYCVRPIYPGTMVLPSSNFGWSMGCPVCQGGEPDCAPGEAIHGEVLSATDQVKVWWGEQNPGPGPGGCEGDEFTLNFDNSQMPAGWTTVDEDGDGFNWILGSGCDGIYLDGGNLAGAGHNASADLIVSGSYSNVYGTALNPDNWLISPVVTLCENSTFSFWACGQDASYVAEHFGVAVSEDGGNSFAMVQEWTMTAKSNGSMGIGRDGNYRAQGNWHQYTVDLGNYAGEGRKIAIRHFNCTDMFILDVDDIQLSAGAKGTRAGIENYNVYRSTDNENYTLIGVVPAVAGQTYYEYIDTPETAGTYYYQVTADYGECESAPAAAYDNPTVDYVVVGVDAVDENNGMTIYPNPTKGNVTIMANGMRHITVVSTLGQVVFDADVENDTYIMNMSQYNAGMYTVRVVTENGVNTSLITVVR